MTDKPMIFSAPMVKALLDGRKTQTRRILKPQPPADAHMVRAYTENAPRAALRNTVGWFVPEAGDLWPCNDGDRIPLPYTLGDRLWVRETWGMGLSDHGDCPRYKATMDYQCGDKIKPPHEGPFKWRSPIHMPRWASRLTLLVTDVRVQRLQEISVVDVFAEGAVPADLPHGSHIGRERDFFRDLWNSLHGPDAWEANPWVCALTFTVHRANIDKLERAA